ncbi:DUF6883 domain-containing protein [Nodosilinea nodulosa]|uniref:DUF6883 domain-containing protein n=1 Tax=Nodosilinea nodulosa TaxID=416001 RepID=UPI0002D883AC|nr:DUF6883 domain-containing protein [Nodosilinea nodulosa]
MKLPNAGEVYIDLEKLRDYSLNPTHSRGKHKARLFAAILGLTSSDTEVLRAYILQALQQYDAVIGMADEYGQRYIVDFPLTRNQNAAIVRTAWIIRPDETFPRLVSCYILR